MSDPTAPETPAEATLRVDESLVSVLASFEKRLGEFSDLITEERRSRKAWIEELIAIERAAREEEQRKEKHARRRGFGIVAVMALVASGMFLGYYRNEQVIACDRGNDIRRSTRSIVLGAIDEVGNYATVSPADIDAILTEVADRADEILPERDCHWWP